MATTKQLAAIRRRLAVNTVEYDGGTVAVDPNMRTFVGVLRSIPGVETTGSCGGHARRRNGDCQAKIGHWFASLRAGRRTIAKLKAFAKLEGIKFEQGPKNRVPACAGLICKSRNEGVWYGFWGKGDPRRAAAKLQRFLANS
jgi:hypothetical protein